MKNTRVQNSILLFCLLLVCIACKQKMSSGEFLKVVETDEALNQIKVFDDMEFKLMYRPDLYYKLKLGKSLNGNNQKTYAFVMSVKDLKTHQEVLRRFIEGESQYGSLVNYLSFAAEKDFSMISAKDTVKPIFYHFERFNNISPIINFDIGFDKSKIMGDVQVVYDDKMFGLGRIYFAFKKEELEKIDHIIVEQK